MRIDVRKRDRYSKGRSDDKRVFGHRIRARFVKNKVGTAWGVGFADLYYDKGFNLIKDLLTVAEKEEIVEKSGGWRSYTPLGGSEEDEIKANGKDNFIEKIDNKENSQLIYKEMKERILYDREEPLYLKEDDEEKSQEETKEK